jgi:hypothetical protein
MAINNASNRVIQATPNGVAYAVSNKELDTVVLAQGQYLGGNTSGIPTPYTIAGAGGNTVSVSANTLTITAPTPPTAGITWNVATSNTTLVKKNGYIASGTTSLVFTLPTSAAAGDEYRVVGSGPLGATFTIQAPTGAVVFLGDTSSAAAGTATSGLPSDAATILCVGANTFSLYGSTGNFNIV